MQQRGSQKSSTKQKHYPFWLGGVAASIAVCFTHPLDLTKLRLQNAPGKHVMTSLFLHTLRNEGVRGLYIGLSASVLRQMTYSLTRFAVYEEIKKIVLQRNPSSSTLPLTTTIAAAGLAGAAGGLVGNPADVILVRMTADMYRKPEYRFGYRGAVDGLVRVVREEGMSTLFRGLTPNMVRAVLMNTSQLSTYDFSKDMLLKSGYFTSGTLAHYLTSSQIAGTVATTICSPADVIRARIMNARAGEHGFEQMIKSFRQEGIEFLFRGWLPAWIRLAPQVC